MIDAADPSTPMALDDNQALNWSVSFCTVAARSVDRPVETIHSATWLIPRSTRAWMSETAGSTARMISTIAPTKIPMTARVTMPAVFAFDHPRRRSASEAGPKVAQIRKATRIDAVTVASLTASAMTIDDETGDDEHAPADRGQATQPAGHHLPRVGLDGRGDIHERSGPLVRGGSVADAAHPSRPRRPYNAADDIPHGVTTPR